jgi:NTE family protein
VTTAVVLSGGANLGAVHVGMLRALIEAGIRPDLIVGTSVGAINGVYIASRWDLAGVDGLGAVWGDMRRSTIFPTRLVGGLLGFIGKRDHLIPPDGLRRLVVRHADFERIEDAPIPLHVVATDLLTGLDRRFSTGPTVDAVMASAAIPAVFPPVMINGVPYIDGGVVNNTPISHAVDLGADEVWVLPAGTACGLDEAPKSTLGIALQAVTVLINRRLQRDIEIFQDRCTMHVLPPLCPLMVGPTDFGQARHLIDRAYLSSFDWIRSPHDESCDLAGLLTHPHDR